MATTKRMVCLANSRKLNGRCLAGKELLNDQPIAWIRPVSSREHEEVSEYERQYEDGSDPRVLDLMDVPLLDPRPKGFQQENWLLDPERYWVRVDRLRWTDLPRLADPIAALWIDGHSTYHGLNDEIPLPLAGALQSSLRLAHVDHIGLWVFKPGEVLREPQASGSGTVPARRCGLPPLGY